VVDELETFEILVGSLIRAENSPENYRGKNCRLNDSVHPAIGNFTRKKNRELVATSIFLTIVNRSAIARGKKCSHMLYHLFKIKVASKYFLSSSCPMPSLGYLRLFLSLLSLFYLFHFCQKEKLKKKTHFRDFSSNAHTNFSSVLCAMGFFFSEPPESFFRFSFSLFTFSMS
jgi:hypothetical protein